MFELSNASSKYFLSENFQTFVGFVCKHIPGSACIDAVGTNKPHYFGKA